jgi:hypothetical protein
MCDISMILMVCFLSCWNTLLQNDLDHQAKFGRHFRLLVKCLTAARLITYSVEWLQEPSGRGFEKCLFYFSKPTVATYFSILEDLLIAFSVPIFFPPRQKKTLHQGQIFFATREFTKPCGLRDFSPTTGI